MQIYQRFHILTFTSLYSRDFCFFIFLLFGEFVFIAGIMLIFSEETAHFGPIASTHDTIGRKRICKIFRGLSTFTLSELVRAMSRWTRYLAYNIACDDNKSIIFDDSQGSAIKASF